MLGRGYQSLDPAASPVSQIVEAYTIPTSVFSLACPPGGLRRLSALRIFQIQQAPDFWFMKASQLQDTPVNVSQESNTKLLWDPRAAREPEHPHLLNI